jgi:hypothetical protein
MALAASLQTYPQGAALLATGATSMPARQLILPALALLALPSLAHALNVDPGQTIILTSTTLSPAYTAGQTRIDHKVDTADLIVAVPGSSATSYKQLTVQLVTNVYRNTGGTLAFAYNISAQDFPQPDPGPPFMQASLPSLNIAHFGGFVTDAHAENIPNVAPSGPVNPAMLSVSRSADGDALQYLFATNTTGLIFRDNTLFSPQLEATTPAVVFVQTDATDYTDFDASVETHSFDGRNPAGYTSAFLTFNSFSPQVSSGSIPPVPEPLTLITLPLAIGALALRRRVR